MVADKIFRIKNGSTVKVTDETRNSSNVLFTPDGGVAVTITAPDGTVVVNGASMTEDATGMWSYTWQSTTSSEKGMYTVMTAATHSGATAKKEDRMAFELY